MTAAKSASSVPTRLPPVTPADEVRRRAVRAARDALPPELAHLASGLIAEALADALALAQGTLSATTEKIYADDWTPFAAWCATCQAPSLPAHPAVVAAYLAHRSKTLGRSGLRLVLAAVAHHHRRAGHSWSSGDPTIATVMRGILRRQRTPVRPAAALGTAEVRRLLTTCGEDRGDRRSLAGLRDRALLLTAFAGGVRRSELVGLTCPTCASPGAGWCCASAIPRPIRKGRGPRWASLPAARKTPARCAPCRPGCAGPTWRRARCFVGSPPRARCAVA